MFLFDVYILHKVLSSPFTLILHKRPGINVCIHFTLKAPHHQFTISATFYLNVFPFGNEYEFVGMSSSIELNSE